MRYKNLSALGTVPIKIFSILSCSFLRPVFQAVPNTAALRTPEMYIQVGTSLLRFISSDPGASHALKSVNSYIVLKP